VKREDVILMAGCGNSRLTEEMFDDGENFLLFVSCLFSYRFLFLSPFFSPGYTNITNIDVSRVVIDQMIDRYKDKPTLQWQQMNVTALDFPDETFDVVIAKATLDAVLCGEGSTANVAKFCSEVSRVLKPTGIFFIVSYGVPDNRLNYLEKEDAYSWTVTVHTVPKPTVSAAAVPSAEDANGVHYIYVCSKGGSAEEG
jgi:SAM-dependent methyltransferase